MSNQKKPYSQQLGFRQGANHSEHRSLHSVNEDASEVCNTAQNASAKSINQQFEIPASCAGLRIDVALTQLLPEFSRARIQRFIKENALTCNQQSIKARQLVIGGEQISLQATLTDVSQWTAEAIALDIVYEDAEILVLHKPVGLVTHPAAGNQQHTLVNALLHHCPALSVLPRAGLVHRLDKNTSGLLVVAKTLNAHSQLVKQLQARSMKREYVAIVEGVLISGQKIDAPMGRHPTQRLKRTVSAFGKPAVTHTRIIERFRAHTLIKCLLETGRTHQIRVHLQHIGYPIVGDRLYGWQAKLPRNCSDDLKTNIRHFNHQALHAKRLSLIHPTTQEEMTWQAPLPDDLTQLIERLREDAND